MSRPLGAPEPSGGNVSVGKRARNQATRFQIGRPSPAYLDHGPRHLFPGSGGSSPETGLRIQLLVEIFNILCYNERLVQNGSLGLTVY
jgi:hypothetical protein